jgi:hypothetical protein
VGKVLVFLLLAIVFIASTSFLAQQVIIKMKELNQIQSELNILETDKANLQKDSSNIK